MLFLVIVISFGMFSPINSIELIKPNPGSFISLTPLPIHQISGLGYRSLLLIASISGQCAGKQQQFSLFELQIQLQAPSTTQLLQSLWTLHDLDSGQDIGQFTGQCISASTDG